MPQIAPCFNPHPCFACLHPNNFEGTVRIFPAPHAPRSGAETTNCISPPGCWRLSYSRLITEISATNRFRLSPTSLDRRHCDPPFPLLRFNLAPYLVAPLLSTDEKSQRNTLQSIQRKCTGPIFPPDPPFSPSAPRLLVWRRHDVLSP